MLYPTKSTTKAFEERFINNALPPIVIKQECSACYESGFAWVEVDLGDNIKHSAWTFCSCKKGKQTSQGSKYNLPVFDHEMKSLFKLKEFPLKAFVPSAFTVNYEKAMWDKVKSFKADLRLSDKFWSQK
jgi:hypothetical protein